MAAFVMVATTGMAFAGVLPSPVQKSLAAAASKVGVELPDGTEDADPGARAPIRDTDAEDATTDATAPSGPGAADPHLERNEPADHSPLLEPGARAEPVEPAEGREPTEPVEPAERPETDDRAEPTEPAERPEPVEPVEPPERPEPAEPAEQPEPVETGSETSGSGEDGAELED